jgi:hypothetical protein
MRNPPAPPAAALNLMTTEYDTYLLRDAITDIMCDKLGSKRWKYVYIDDETLHHHSDGSGPED